MYEDEIKFTAKLTYKAKQGEREFEQIIRYERRSENTQRIEIDVKELQYQIMDEKQHYYLNIFLRALEEAAEMTKEYDRLEIFTENIANIISRNIREILSAIIENGVYGVYDVMTERAGDMGDFWQGVEHAREMIGVSGKDPGRAARYWMVKVWPDADKYEDTIAYRFQVWEDKAPYWHFLEHGNYFQTNAFPKFTQTLFLSKAAYRIWDDVEIEVAERKEAAQEDSYEVEEINEYYTDEKLNLFNRAVSELEDNPEAYPPGYIWGTYKSLEDEREYKVYRTKTGKIGRRLVR